MGRDRSPLIHEPSFTSALKWIPQKPLDLSTCTKEPTWKPALRSFACTMEHGSWSYQGCCPRNCWATSERCNEGVGRLHSWDWFVMNRQARTDDPERVPVEQTRQMEQGMSEDHAESARPRGEVWPVPHVDGTKNWRGPKPVRGHIKPGMYS